MEHISGTDNWDLVIRWETAGITVLWAQTCEQTAALPEELFGLPVRFLADHALTPGRPAPEGERVRVTCGTDTAEAWDNSALADLHLPDALEGVGDYAFYNCSALKTLRLRDTVRHWGGGALMNCRVLDTFHLVCTGMEGELMAYLADELPGELDMTLTWADGAAVRLIFPEYVEVYEENCPAHHFDYNIYGAGYSYHHCFYRKQLSLKAYDELWRPMLGMEYDAACALRLAWWRLRYPTELTERAEADYRAYLAAHVPAAGQWLLSQKDTEGLSALLRSTEPTREELSDLCAMAREQERPEALALLLEAQHRRFPTGAAKSFDL